MDASSIVPTSEGSEGLASTLGAGHALDADDVSLGSVLLAHFFSPQIPIEVGVYKSYYRRLRPDFHCITGDDLENQRTD